VHTTPEVLPILLGGLICGLFLARDRTRYGNAVVASIGQPTLAPMVLAWPIPGVLGALLSESGLIQSSVWFAQRVGAAPPGYVAASFLACVLVSASTGTSFGTLLAVGPLLYSAGLRWGRMRPS
jgi:Na+/H+ antiporter NhaC